MTDPNEHANDVRRCPNCGGTVTYLGVGRRPVWCSTRCRNQAAAKRRGAHLAAVEVRMVEVPKQPRPGGRRLRRRATQTGISAEGYERLRGELIDLLRRYGIDPDALGEALLPVPPRPPRPATPTREQAVRAVSDDAEAVGSVLAHLERRRQTGDLGTDEWVPVRNALQAIAVHTLGC